MTKWIKRAFKCYRAFKQDPLLKNQHLKYSSVCILSMGFPEHFLGIWHGELEKKWNTCHSQHGCYSDVCSSHWNLKWCILQGGEGGTTQTKTLRAMKENQQQTQPHVTSVPEIELRSQPVLTTLRYPWSPRHCYKVPLGKDYNTLSDSSMWQTWQTVSCATHVTASIMAQIQIRWNLCATKALSQGGGFSQRRPCNKRWIIAEAYNKFSDLSLSEYCLKPSIFWSPWHEPE